MINNLYYIHEIIPCLYEEYNNNNITEFYKKANKNILLNYYVVLLPAYENHDLKSKICTIKLGHVLGGDYSINEKYEKYKQKHIYEGCFVRLISENSIEYANVDKEAQRLRFLNNIARGKLKKLYSKENLNPEDNSLSNEETDISDVRSYHVNVGHGNTSFIVFRKQGITHIWLIDCSEYDFLKHHNYQNNIIHTLEYIEALYKTNIKIEKLMITHTHYDHISGINNLIDKNYLIGAEIWLNTKFNDTTPTFKKLVDKLIKIPDIQMREPIKNNSTNNIKIWYPEVCYKGNKSTLPVDERTPGGKTNNSSIIYNIHLGNKSMVFPGDIEIDGWNLVLDCNPYDNKADYYCISHHGSISGHIRTKCPAFQAYTIQDIQHCTSNIKTVILMGRDGAYSGLIAPTVKGCYGNRLHITTDDNNGKETIFIELDWKTGTVIRH